MIKIILMFLLISCNALEAISDKDKLEDLFNEPPRIFSFSGTTSITGGSGGICSDLSTFSITGSDFTANTTLEFRNGTGAVFASSDNILTISETLIQFNFPAAPGLAPSETWDTIVRNPNGHDELTNTFTTGTCP